MSEEVLLRGARVVDPSQDYDGIADIRIRHGRIAEFGPDLATGVAESTVDLTGKVVTPGLVDLCVHLREPGFENLETIRSGAQAALAGGFTSIAAMPDTDPPVDNEASVTYVRLKGQEARAARVFVVGALTRGRQGKLLSEMGGMQRAGAVAFSDEEAVVERNEVFARAVRYSRMVSCPVMTRCEDPGLRGRGVANNGLLADLLGLPAIGAGTEELMLQRNIRFARQERAPLHLLHLSTADSVSEMRQAREMGVAVSCSVTPPHLLFNEDKIGDYDPIYKFRPPLRSESDRLALLKACRDGVIDAISSAHAPRGEAEKDLEFEYAATGCGGLETTFAVLHTQLVLSGELSFMRLVQLLSTGPAKVLGIEGGSLAPGCAADVVAFDVETPYTVRADEFVSRSRITPFEGWEVRGRAERVWVGGDELLSAVRCRAGQR